MKSEFGDDYRKILDLDATNKTNEREKYICTKEKMMMECWKSGTFALDWTIDMEKILNQNINEFASIIIQSNKKNNKRIT
ncbi:MAG: hypothetical protein Edafosvirus42_6 [Edafosvirus sp.]|uniref:Uncharacterized protein n=1 Tax=Edafosvirus sp. TaxID=2487765 RepID=A0A3G4ZVF6_9VIRU|nr:MAG: hypothetical protein Edafosvirus42_6 [Edafosvirus sp.]